MPTRPEVLLPRGVDSFPGDARGPIPCSPRGPNAVGGRGGATPLGRTASGEETAPGPAFQYAPFPAAPATLPQAAVTSAH